MRFSIEEIVETRDHKESWERTESVVKIWKRKTKEKLWYNHAMIKNAYDDDLSWILPSKVAKITYRKVSNLK
ncbi:hypothetical protein SteCoe_10741 [Stentor coeruleus]|uniref:Uncharacterized protein n=1 Tax=Stentor coeruleus TaxID=5963 RepID=A0A1R2CEX3_9CILI|nr:hypothetical protein SteCoe_10741 [Stentor coeruleus]